MNERDSDNIAADFIARGWKICDDPAEADAAVVNTCSVREQAEQKAIGKLAHLIEERKDRKSPFPVIGVTGCMAQNKGAALLEILPQLDFVAGSRKTHMVAQIAVDAVNERKAGILAPKIPRGLRKNRADYSIAKVDISDDSTSHLAINRHAPERESGVCAFVSIMQGCGMNCSYCIVPKVRGIQRSRPEADIIDEIKRLADRGVKEVTLLGQVVNAYGREAPQTEKVSRFVRLLEKIDALDSIERIRFTSPHPSYFGDDLISAYGTLGKLCEYVHLPLQSGSDRILNAMARPYRTARFLEIVEKLRARAPKMSISTDVIVGYPDETEDDFAATLDAFKTAGFDMAYIFKYSPREGTKSALLADSVSEEQKEARNQTLLVELGAQSKKFNDAMTGATEQILVESRAKRGASMMMGRTRTHRKVIFKADESLIGRLAEVRIESAGVSALNGILV